MPDVKAEWIREEFMSSLLNKIVSLCASRRDPEDSDPQETEKWLEALEAVVEHAGRARMEYLLD